MVHLRKLIFVDEKIFMKLIGRHRNLINIMALLTPISALVAGYILYYATYFLLESLFLSILVGGLGCTVLFLHDSTLLEEFRKSRIYGRIVASVLMALVIIIPLKVDMLEEQLIDQVNTEVVLYNASIDEELLALEMQLLEEEKEIDLLIAEAAKKYAETGSKQELIDARRTQRKFLANKERILSAKRTACEARKRTVETSKLDLAGYYFFNMFNTEASTAVFLNLFIFIGFLGLEASPAIFRLLLEESEYLLEKVHQQGIEQGYSNELRAKEVEIMATYGDLKKAAPIIKEHMAMEILKEGLQKGFSNSNRLQEILAQMQAPPKEEKVDDDLPELNYTNN